MMRRRTDLKYLLLWARHVVDSGDNFVQQIRQKLEYLRGLVSEYPMVQSPELQTWAEGAPTAYPEKVDRAYIPTFLRILDHAKKSHRDDGYTWEYGPEAEHLLRFGDNILAKHDSPAVGAAICSGVQGANFNACRLADHSYLGLSFLVLFLPNLQSDLEELWTDYHNQRPTDVQQLHAVVEGELRRQERPTRVFQ